MTDKKLEFHASEFLSDNELGIAMRKIFPEWKELVETLVTHYAKHANKKLAPILERLASAEGLLEEIRGDAETGSTLEMNISHHFERYNP